MADNRASVNVRAETAAGSYHRHAELIELCYAMVNKLRSLRNYVEIHGLIESDDQRFHFLNRHTAVGKEALKHSYIVLKLVEEFLVSYEYSAASTEAELARGEVYDVKEVCYHSCDLGDRLILHRLLAHLDEVEVVLKKRSIEHGRDAEGFSEVGCLLHILVGDRLTADKVGACFKADVSDIFSALLSDARLHLVEVDIALEGKCALYYESLILDKLLYTSAETGNVRFRSGEVVVHDNTAVGLYKVLCDDVLTSASLMGREKVLYTEYLLELVSHTVEGLAACVRIVCAKHS